MPGDISNSGPNARTEIAPIGPGGQKLPTIEPAAQKCAFQLHFQSLPTLLCLFSRGAKYSMCHKYLTWLEQDRDPCQLSPIGVRIRSLIHAAIIARHPTCGRDTPLCAEIHYVPTESNMDVLLIAAHSHNEATPVLKSPVTGLGWR